MTIQHVCTAQSCGLYQAERKFGSSVKHVADGLTSTVQESLAGNNILSVNCVPES